MTDASPEVVDALRRWAKGMNTTEAAAELLIRARNGAFATIDRPWIKLTNHSYWIDFCVMTEHLHHCPPESNGYNYESPPHSARTTHPRCRWERY